MEPFVIVIVLLIIYFVGTTLRKRAQERRGQQSVAQVQAFKWPSLDDFEFEVVGESNYQAALMRLAGNHGTDNASALCLAELAPEDNNKYDKSAVQVLVQGQCVAYFSRDDARSFRRRLGNKGLTGQTTFCDAVIVGGGTKRNGDKLMYGIKLDIKPFDD